MGEAEWRGAGRRGPGRGQWRIPAGAQEEANRDLEGTEERPHHQSCFSLRRLPTAQPGERMGGGGQGKEFWEIGVRLSGPQEGVKKREKKVISRIPNYPSSSSSPQALAHALPTWDVLPSPPRPPRATSSPPFVHAASHR